MNFNSPNIEAVRIKDLANLENAHTLKISYFDKSPQWLMSKLNGDVSLHNGKVSVIGQTKQAEPGDYLVNNSGNIEIYTHDEIMEQYVR